MMPRLFLTILLFAVLTIKFAPALDAILEPKKTGEVEYSDAEEKDKEFDNDLLTTEGRPSEEPNPDRVEALYNARKSDSTLESGVSVNLYVKYLERSDWYLRYYKCCPRSQDYDCRSVHQRLPCFSHVVNGRREWCCPFYPNIYIANCNCGKCVRQCPGSDCFSIGNCTRRYTARRFWAVITGDGTSSVT